MASIPKPTKRRRPKPLPPLVPNNNGSSFLTPSEPNSNRTIQQPPEKPDPFQGLRQECSFDVDTESGSIVLIAREMDSKKVKKLGQGAYSMVLRKIT